MMNDKKSMIEYLLKLKEEAKQSGKEIVFDKEAVDIEIEEEFSALHLHFKNIERTPELMFLLDFDLIKEKITLE
jgi:translation initiation factor 2 beta subunit (eIF-2beta)/eIF-5